MWEDHLLCFIYCINIFCVTNISYSSCLSVQTIHCLLYCLMIVCFFCLFLFNSLCCCCPVFPQVLLIHLSRPAHLQPLTWSALAFAHAPLMDSCHARALFWWSWALTLFFIVFVNWLKPFSMITTLPCSLLFFCLEIFVTCIVHVRNLLLFSLLTFFDLVLY